MTHLKKLVLIAIAATVVFTSCSKQEMDGCDEPENAVQPGERNCGTMEAFYQQIQEDPAALVRMNEIENFTQNYAASARLLADGTVEIPVVVNVLYKTAAQNVSAAQIQSQIDVLNADFKALNADYNNTPSIFQGVRSGKQCHEKIVTGRYQPNQPDNQTQYVGL
jgi:hypothetical protein